MFGHDSQVFHNSGDIIAAVLEDIYLAQYKKEKEHATVSVNSNYYGSK